MASSVATARVLSKLCLAALAVWLFAATVYAEQLTHTLTVTADEVRVGVDHDGMATATVPEFESLGDAGSPILPYKVVSFLLPPGHQVAAYEAVSADRVLLADKFKPAVSTVPIAEDGTAGNPNHLLEHYRPGVSFPQQQIVYLSTGYLHGHAIASFAVFPTRIEGQRLLLDTTLRIQIETSWRDEQPDVAVRERYRPGFDRYVSDLLNEHVVNPETRHRYATPLVVVEKSSGGFAPTSYPSLEGSPVDYLIVTTAALAGDFQRLADWKTAKGVPTVVRTVEWIVANTKNGVDQQETIRSFVRDAYEKWGITYLLLGGDTDILPPRYAFSRFFGGGVNVPAELYFGCLDGSWNDNHDEKWGEGVYIGVPYDNPDLYAEVYYGRIACSDPAEINIIIDKIIDYETAATRDHLDKFVFLAEVLFPVDWSSGEPTTLDGAIYPEDIVAVSMGGTGLDIERQYQNTPQYPGSVQESFSAAMAKMQSGVNFVTHVGHGFRFNLSVGDASIQIAEADTICNDGMWFNLYMLNCTAAAFNFSCLAEHFMENPKGGAVSVIGANESAFPTGSESYMDEYHDLVFAQDVIHIGEAFARSRLPKTPMAESIDNVDLWTHQIYTLLGDPEMTLHNGPVDTLIVNHAPSVGLGEAMITVSVTSGILPLEGAKVCLSKGSDDYAVGTTDALGTVILPFTAESVGSISVVTTALNKSLKQTWIDVTPAPGAYVNYSASGLVVDDDLVGGTFGNGDGIIDAGEIVDLTLELVNTGGAASDSVWATMTSSDGSVVVLDGIAGFGVIGPGGGTAVALDPVRVDFSASIADEAAITFDLAIEDASAGMWSDAFAKEVHAPDLELIGVRVDDTINGNGDGVIDPNERFHLFYEIKNYGTGSANALTATLEDVDNAFTFYDSTDTYPDLALLAQAENNAGFDISEANPAIENALRIAITDLHGRVYVDTFELRVPQPPGNLRFDPSIGPDRMQVAFDQSASSDVMRYLVYSSTTSGGPYTLSNVDPLEHAVYMHTGLLPATKYYYVASAVDMSGNESAMSAEFETSTNPAQMPGFPVQLMIQTTSTPAVGDIDGDGDNELVAGNKHVFAWHHDGQEIMDGDANPQTWGVLNTEGDEFTAAITLGNIDGNAGMEILAADLFTQSVYCFDGVGNNVAGWPKQGLAAFRAAPVVGDIDGDEDPEVLAVDEQGRLYAWHANGTEYRDGDSNPGTDGVFFETAATTFHYVSPTLCDVDNDGISEIILGTRDGTVYCLKEDGTSAAGWPFVLPGEISGHISTGDIDDDGLPEFVMRANTSEVYLVNHDGTVAPGWPRFLSMNLFFAPSAALGDVNNDGKLEIVIVKLSGSSKQLHVIDHQANNLPGWPKTLAEPTESSPVLADVNGDGALDIILGDESGFVYAWDLTGALIQGFPIQTFDAVRASPFLTDVDSDGDVDLFLYSWDKDVYLYDLTGAYVPNLSPWPTLQANVHRNGKHNFVMPTGIGNAAFSFRVTGSAVDLMWLVSAGQAMRFELERSEVVAGEAAGFAAVASDLVVDASGFVHFNDLGVEMGRTYVYRLVSSTGGGEVFTSEEIYIPVSRAELAQNFPNPFNPTTRIAYWVPEGSPRQVQLVVYDVSGARVRTLVDGLKGGGQFEVQWNGLDDRGSRVASGVYFYRLSQPGYRATKKMVLVK